MFGPDLGGQDLVKAGIRVIDDPLCCRGDLGAFEERRGFLHHSLCHIKDDGYLLLVRCGAVDFRGRLIICV